MGVRLTPSTPAQSVVFDIGNVLVVWDPRRLYVPLFGGNDERAARFLRDVVSTDWILENDAGRSVRDGVAALVASHPEHAEAIRAFDARWQEMLGDVLADNVAVAEELLARGVPLFVLSNWPPDKFHHALERLPLLKRFQDLVVSGQVKLRKPDPAIFRLLLERNRLDPARTAFIDDTAEHVVTARSLGMHGIHLAPGVSLRRELASLGL